MIGESLHFYFDERKSTDFGIINVKVEEGLYEEPLVSNKDINEVYIRGRDEPYFNNVTVEPKTLILSFGFLEPWNEELIDEVVRWLNVDTYKKLYFEGDIDKVFYALPVEGITKIHNGLKQGYLSLTMRTSSNNSFSHDVKTKVIDTLKLSVKQKEELPTIKVGNKGHFSIYPKIWIEKISEGDIVIYNTTNNNKEFRFKNIDIGEKLFVDCKLEVIKTSKHNTYRYDDFNDEYLELIYGENILKVSKNMKIKLSYKYIFS